LRADRAQLHQLDVPRRHCDAPARPSARAVHLSSQVDEHAENDWPTPASERATDELRVVFVKSFDCAEVPLEGFHEMQRQT
jgi:hypothetical protein